jgi:hypothetical protein
MKLIKWELPFKNIAFLASLADLLSQEEAVILITGMQEGENITHCNIGIKNCYTNNDEVVLHIGTMIGAHSANWQLMMDDIADSEMETELDDEFFLNLAKELQNQVFEEEREEEENLFEKAEKQGDFDEDLFAEAEEQEGEKYIDDITVPVVEEIVETPLRMFLRKILVRFKKPEIQAKHNILSNFKKED